MSNDRKAADPRELPLAPPGGMRDLLPPTALQRSAIRRQLMDVFALHGYQRVTTPTFEYAAVLERGLQTVDRRDLVRFVEPETGEVAVLRPDITPQVARIVATRLQDRLGPWRLAYEGTVIRRRRGRARKQQQVFQSGIECVGLKGADADAEVISTASKACTSLGLNSTLIELAQVKIGKVLLQDVPDSYHAVVVEELSNKDAARLKKTLSEARVPSASAKRLLALTEMHGDASVIKRARKRFTSKPAARAIDELERVVEKLDALGIAENVRVDLGDIRRQAYYTGVSVTFLLAPGPGEPIGMGGRYDQLLGAYGASQPATGFAFNVDALEWALREAGADLEQSLSPRIVVAGGSKGARNKTVDALRAASICSVAFDTKSLPEAKLFAKQWAYDALLFSDTKGTRAIRCIDGKSRKIDLKTLGVNNGNGTNVNELGSWARNTDEGEA